MKDFNLDLLNRLLFKQCDSDIKDVIYKKIKYYISLYGECSTN